MPKQSIKLTLSTGKEIELTPDELPEVAQILVRFAPQLPYQVPQFPELVPDTFPPGILPTQVPVGYPWPPPIIHWHSTVPYGSAKCPDSGKPTSS